MHICILTLFPDMFHGPLDLSILKRAQEKRTLTLDIMNIRDFAQDKYKTVDDRPYGGGKGMIMRVDVLDRALVEAKRRIGTKTSRTILLDPQGKKYSQTMATSLATLDALILVCGHYEGVDERVRLLVDEQLSIGDYVLTGGEIPAMVVVDSITRLIPGTLVSTDATSHESFQPHDVDGVVTSLLETPQYTRPPEYHGYVVPDILLSGDHARIEAWRTQEAHTKTKKLRKDLLKSTK